MAVILKKNRFDSGSDHWHMLQENQSGLVRFTDGDPVYAGKIPVIGRDHIN
jgi:hypothetical protein